MDNKVTSLADAKPLEVEEVKQNEMQLVDASEFEGKAAVEVKVEDLEEMYALAQEMVKFAHARGGAGLALPQIGIMKKAFVMLDNTDKWEMMINPEYFGGGKKSWVYERSLSYDGVYALQRFKRINAAYYSIDVDKNDRLIMKKSFKQMSGLKAFMYQNLVDMLKGKTGRIDGVFVHDDNEEANADVNQQQTEG